MKLHRPTQSSDKLFFTARQLPYAAMVILLTLNVLPRTVSSGVHRWFAARVPEPERFNSAMHKAPTATWEFGFPLTVYVENGREFTRKGGDKIFWPSPEQEPFFAKRFSFAALASNAALLIGIVALLRLAAKWWLKNEANWTIRMTCDRDRL